MPFTPTAGKFATAEIEGTTDIVLPGTDWELDLDPNSQETDNFRDGVQTMVTLEVAMVTLNLIWDSALPPHLSAQGTLKNGTALTLNLYTDPSHTVNKAFVVQAMIVGAKLKNAGMKDKLVYEVTARQHGTLTYPTA